MPSTRAPFEAAVTGLGLVSAAGTSVAENWERVRSGRSCATLDETIPEVTVTCRARGFDADAILGAFAARQMERFVQLAIVAARQAVLDAGWDTDTWDGARVGVILGNSLGGMQSVERQHAHLLD